MGGYRKQTCYPKLNHLTLFRSGTYTYMQAEEYHGQNHC